MLPYGRDMTDQSPDGDYRTLVPWSPSTSQQECGQLHAQALHHEPRLEPYILSRFGFLAPIGCLWRTLSAEPHESLVDDRSLRSAGVEVSGMVFFIGC